MAWYPVSVAMAWDMCTCAVKTNLLMENRPYLCELPRLGIFVIFPITISGVIYAAVVSMWSGYGVYEEWKHTQFFFFFFHILLLLPHSFTHGQSLWAHLCSPRFIIYLTEGLADGIWTPHKLSCRLQCDAYHFHSPGSLAYNLSASPSRCHLLIQVKNSAEQLTA